MSARSSRSVRGDLFQLLDDAINALGVPKQVAATAHALIKFVPRDAPCPVSPARVQDLADKLKADPRTIRNHIHRLIGLGLAENRCGDGGHRIIRRHKGRIVALAGIDFSPMLARRAEIEAEAAQLEVEAAERAALRAEITQTRRRFRLLAPSSPSGAAATALEIFAAMPRRYAHLRLGELAILRDRMLRLLAILAPLEETPEAPAPSLEPSLDAPRQPEKTDRPALGITPLDRKTTDQTSERKVEPVLGVTSPARKISPDKPVRLDRPNSIKDSKESVNSAPDPIENLLPADWREEYEAAGQRSLRALAATARSRSIRLGIPSDTWEDAIARLGTRDTALLTLAAENPDIRCPAAWMRAMTNRAAHAPLDLSRNLLALKRRQAFPDPERTSRCGRFTA